jgi:hypothetical protein
MGNTLGNKNGVGAHYGGGAKVGRQSPVVRGSDGGVLQHTADVEKVRRDLNRKEKGRGWLSSGRQG